MKKIIYILYSGDDWNLEQPDYTPAMKFGYETWGEICSKQNIELYRGSAMWFDSEAGNFKKGWQFRAEDHTWIKQDKVIIPTVVYDKTRIYDKVTGETLYSIIDLKNKITNQLNLVNMSKFSEFLDSKLNQYLVFQELIPKSSIIEKGVKYKNETGKRIVVKKFFGSGGKEVNILEPNEELQITEISLVQEFVSATKNDELRDVRIVYIGEEPIYALSRHAKNGSLFTNFHQGAKVVFRDLNEDEIKRAIGITESNLLPKIRIFNKKVFSVDYMIDASSGKYFLIEINTTPGLDVFDTETRPILVKFLDKLNRYLITTESE